jgi:hypothetical protein
MNPKIFVDLLGVLGKKLLTYHDNIPLLGHSIPDETWLLCPNLERIRTGFRWSSSLQPPSSLVTFGLPKDIRFNPLCMPAPDLRAAGIQTVTIDCEWIRALDLMHPIMDYVSYALEHGLTFKDVRGVTFQDLVVCILLYRKGGRTGEDPLQQCRPHYYQF